MHFETTSLWASLGREGIGERIQLSLKVRKHIIESSSSVCALPICASICSVYWIILTFSAFCMLII